MREDRLPEFHFNPRSRERSDKNQYANARHGLLISIRAYGNFIHLYIMYKARDTEDVAKIDHRLK